MNPRIIDLFIYDIIPISKKIDCTNLQIDLDVLVKELTAKGIKVTLTKDRKFLEVSND